MNWKRIFTIWIVIFGVFLVVSNFFVKRGNGPDLTGEIIAATSKESYAQRQEVILRIENNTAETLVLPLSCPKNPFRVFRLQGADWIRQEAETDIDCEGLRETSIASGEKQNITFAFWNNALFSEPGIYRIEVPAQINGEEKSISSPQFTVKKAGIFRTVWSTFFYEPILNLLIFLTVKLPGRTLALGIIILTILIRLLLLIPSQRAIESQKKLQEVQPKLDAIKKKYAGNQERIAKETMEIWKKEKVNPFGSCLPLLIQFPFLIAIYYVIRNGLNPDNISLLYGSLQSVDFSAIKTGFLGIFDLTKTNTFLLPVIVGLLQYIQMKMTLAKKKMPALAEKGSEMQMANNMMVYFMPILIALFTASVPAGVGLYWGVSTVFGIGQQIYADVAAKAKRTDLR